MKGRSRMVGMLPLIVHGGCNHGSKVTIKAEMPPFIIEHEARQVGPVLWIQCPAGLHESLDTEGTVLVGLELNSRPRQCRPQPSIIRPIGQTVAFRLDDLIRKADMRD